MKCKKKCTKKNWLNFIVTTLSFYNLIFVPMQFAFRIEYNQMILVMEIFTITFYVLDAYERYKRLRNLD